MSLLAIPFAALAGGLTILSPCILPIAPVVLSSAVTQSKLGPLALALGLGLSFAFFGVVLSLAEAAFGFDVELTRQIGAVVMIGVGILTFLPKSADVFALATSGISARAAETAAPINGQSIFGQFAIGALLALVWSPCIGPTLGAAFALSSQGQNLFWAGATMLAFGLGATTMLIVLGYGLQGSLKKNRGALLTLSRYGNTIMGVSMLIVGVSVLSGLDIVLSGIVAAATPDWIVALTTKF